MAKKSSIASEDVSPFMKDLVGQLSGLKKNQRRDSREVSFTFVDPTDPQPDRRSDKPEEPQTLFKSILNVLDGSGKNTVERLAFETTPASSNQYSSLYRAKQRLIPDTILKRISIQDDLVAAIVNARSNHLSAFGRPRPDRFSLGFIIDPKPGVLDRCNDEQKKDIQDRIEASRRSSAPAARPRAGATTTA
jgi:hypothetical protein